MVHFFSYILWRTALVFSIVLLMAPRLFSQCNPDITPPYANCVTLANVSLSEDGTYTIVASDPVINFNESSSDNCCLGDLTLRRVVDGPCDSDGLPDDFAPTITFCCADIGPTFLVEMRVNDCAGNHSECQTIVKIEDKLPPILQAPPDLTISCENFDPTLNAHGVATATDNCCLNTISQSADYSLFDTICSKGTIFRTFIAYDCYGNSSQGTQRIVVNYEQDYFIRFPDDLVTTPNGNGNYGEPVFFGVECEVMGVSYNDQIFTNVSEADIRIERTWTIISWCSFDPLQGFIDVPNPQPENPLTDPANLPGPIVSASGTPAPWAPTVVDLTPQGPLTDFSTYYTANANGYSYKQIIWLDVPDPAVVTGKVFVDTTNNCTFDSGEPPLSGWKVKIEGLVSGLIYEAFTDTLGVYTKGIDPVDTLVEVSLAAAYNYGQNCPSVYTLSTAAGQETEQDFPVKLETGCPILSVDISAPFLRRCFSGTYTVQACNLSSETVDNIYTEVALDSYLDFNSSTVPGTAIGNNTWSFDLGTLEAGACTSFQIDVHVNCDAPLGYTHCTEAHIYPDTVCNTSNDWSGADLKVTGFCDGDSVHLTITNVGDGAMTESQEFVVVEDVVMYLSAPFQLDNGESTTFTMPANGATWRLQTPEVAYHPWGGVEAKAVEGCGGLNMTGLVTLFSFNTPDPFETVDCQENIGSYDPNDKQAFPKGYGAQHFLEANTDIEYRIRFQNTGTDTAFTVVVMDTLSQYLDVASVRPGAASHIYDFAVLDGNVLRFRFDNILLPDSNVNQVASNGFVTFNITQKPDNAIGTFIENRAAIYFDFNEPVLTNTTFHTIGDHFVLVSTDNNHPSLRPLRVYPNPSVGTVYFELPEQATNNRFTLTDNLGKTIVTTEFSGKTFRFEKGAIAPGVYFYNIMTGIGGLFSGKVVLK